MKAITRTALLAAATLAAAGAVNAWMGQQSSETSLPGLPQRPTEVVDISYALPFTLSEGYVDYWTAEQETVTAGYILALQVDPDLAYPRQGYNKVLYVGDQVAERTNPGHPSGTVIVVVPSATDGSGMPTLDLHQAPMWFGDEALPEQITANDIADQREMAESRGIVPFSSEDIEAALAKSGGTTPFENRVQLDGVIAELILAHIADTPENQADMDTARGMQAPLVK
jgi:hypothetical protein